MTSGRSLRPLVLAAFLAAGTAGSVLYATSGPAAPGRSPALARGGTEPASPSSAAGRRTPAGAGENTDHAVVSVSSVPSVLKVPERHLTRIPEGTYLPLYTAGGRTDLRVEVEGFALDARAVTRAEFAAFVATHPEWRRSRVRAELARAGYLASWRGDLDYGDAVDGARPVTEVPLAAAKAFCAAEGKRLPTTDEWEYVAAASAQRRDATSDDAFKQRLLELYTRPRPAQPAPVGSTFRNVYGLWDLHGLVWEWTVRAEEQAMDDMPGMTHAEQGEHERHEHGKSKKHDMGCAGSAAGASDPRDYAAFLRYAFREAVRDGSLASSLGFRCAR